MGTSSLSSSKSNVNLGVAGSYVSGTGFRQESQPAERRRDLDFGLSCTTALPVVCLHELFASANFI